MWGSPRPHAGTALGKQGTGRRLRSSVVGGVWWAGCSLCTEASAGAPWSRGQQWPPSARLPQQGFPALSRHTARPTLVLRAHPCHSYQLTRVCHSGFCPGPSCISCTLILVEDLKGHPSCSPPGLSPPASPAWNVTPGARRCGVVMTHVFRAVARTPLVTAV